MGSVLYADDFTVSFSLWLWLLIFLILFLLFYFKDLFGVVPAKTQQENPPEEKAKQSELLKKASSLLFSSDEEVLRTKVWLKGVTGLYTGQSMKLSRQEPQSNQSLPQSCELFAIFLPQILSGSR